MKLRSIVPAIAAAAAGLVIAFAPAAGATTSQTIHLNGVPIDVGPAGCVPGDVTIIGTGVEHMTTNNAGDSWVTGTLTGAASAGAFSGSATAWFGVEANNKNFVTIFILNAQLTDGSGNSVNIHQQGTVTFNANGIPVVFNPNGTVTCH